MLRGMHLGPADRDRCENFSAHCAERYLVALIMPTCGGLSELPTDHTAHMWLEQRK